MTHTLILMRHAKSSWEFPALDDHARPLNDRGRRSAAVLGDWLRSRGHVPDQVLCSSATRTRETFAGLKLAVPVVFTDVLYAAGSVEMLEVLRRATARRILMLGHNPGIAELASDLVGTPPPHQRFEDYPTGATLVAEFQISDWDEVDWEAGKAVDFVVPRDLM